MSFQIKLRLPAALRTVLFIEDTTFSRKFFPFFILTTRTFGTRNVILGARIRP